MHRAIIKNFTEEYSVQFVSHLTTKCNLTIVFLHKDFRLGKSQLGLIWLKYPYILVSWKRRINFIISSLKNGVLPWERSHWGKKYGKNGTFFTPNFVYFFSFLMPKYIQEKSFVVLLILLEIYFLLKTRKWPYIGKLAQPKNWCNAANLVQMANLHWNLVHIVILKNTKGTREGFFHGK